MCGVLKRWAKKGKAEAPAGSKKTAATRPAATVPKHEEVTTAWDADDQEKPAVQRGGSNGTTLLSGAAIALVKELYACCAP